ncbi:MAG: prenyltransferase, partial [Actinomycetota bacterium]
MPPDSATVDFIAATQAPSGAIPWWPGGRVDPWNHIESAMGLDAGGRHDAATRAYVWLAQTQRPDGAWPAGYLDGAVIDPTLDANFSSYVGAGVWHHWLATEDDRFLADLWPVVEAAIEFTLSLQRDDGTICWARDASYRPWPGALLTSCSCIHLSLRCAISIAETLGHERPDWELSLETLVQAVTHSPDAFEPKDRFSMDWYYPVLGGVLRDGRGNHRLKQE